MLPLLFQLTSFTFSNFKFLTFSILPDISNFVYKNFRSHPITFLLSFYTSNILHFTSLYHLHFLPAVFFFFLVQQILPAMLRPCFCIISPILPVLPF